MTVTTNAWPLVGRDEELEFVCSTLLEDRNGGVLVVGEAGIGKTLIARHAVAALADRFEHIYVRGSAATSATPYGALSVVLAQLDAATATNPLLLLSALQDLFELRRGGKRTLMLVDNVEALDAGSAMVIAHLARVGAVRLLVICEDMQRTPVELFDLWKDDVLRRLDVEPLDLGKTAALLKAGLGATVSRSAALELWVASGGNPRYVQALAETDSRSGHLFIRDGVWVSDGRPRERSGKQITEWVTGQLNRFSPEQRAVAETVAVAGAVPVELLLGTAASEVIDELQTQGILRTDHGTPPLLHPVHEAFGEVVRSQLVSPRGRELLLKLVEAPHTSPLPGTSRMALAHWCLDNGIDQEPPALVDAARLANDIHQPDAALTFIGALKNAGRDPHAVLETARALAITGEVDAALQVLDPLLGSPAAAATETGLWVRLMLTQARLVLRSHGRHAEADSLLAEVRTRIEKETSPEEPLLALIEAAEDFAAERDLFEGRCAAVVESGSVLVQQRLDRHRPSDHLAGLLTSALALTGRQQAAVETGRALLARVSGADRGPLDMERAGAHLFEALLLAGYWEETMAMAAEANATAGPTLYEGSSAEFTEGLLHTFAGRGDSALAKLGPAISQLRIRDRQGLLPIAEAACAYSHSLNGDAEAALSHLQGIDLEPQRYSWQVRSTVAFFRVLAQGSLGDRAEAAAELARMADIEAEAGNRGQELLFLSQAVQLGADQLAERLGALAADSEGPLAESCALFGKGIAAAHPEMLLDAASSALHMGNFGLATDAAVRAIDALQEDSDAMIGVYAEQIARRAAAPGRRSTQRKILSERERSIARLAARGASNRTIAEAEHVSVRTVEGHVHQVLTKLGLSSRKQLSQVFR